MSIIETPTTPLSHVERAKRVLIQIREAVQSIPGFGFVGKTHRKRIALPASLPDKFLIEVAAAVDASPRLSAAAELTGDEVREVVEYCNAYTPVVAEHDNSARGLRETIVTKRHDMVQRCLGAYSIAKSFNRPSDREALIPHLKAMKRALPLGKRASVESPEAPKPQPPPAQPPTEPPKPPAEPPKPPEAAKGGSHAT